jgi:hypothetical protein
MTVGMSSPIDNEVERGVLMQLEAPSTGTRALPVAQEDIVSDFLGDARTASSGRRSLSGTPRGACRLTAPRERASYPVAGAR